MTNVNSPSDELWRLLHQARALLTDRGFAAPVPPLPASGTSRSVGSSLPGEGYNDLAARYGGQMVPGAVWPSGTGGPAPQALLLTENGLSSDAQQFVRSWFENPRVSLDLDSDVFIQPIPRLSGAPAAYQAMARDLCGLLKPKAVLSLGAGPAQKLLGAPLSLDVLRGSDYRFDRWSIVTTLDPEDFLPLDDGEKNRFKAQVWRDLQRLLGKLKYG